MEGKPRGSVPVHRAAEARVAVQGAEEGAEEGGRHRGFLGRSGGVGAVGGVGDHGHGACGLCDVVAHDEGTPVARPVRAGCGVHFG